MRYIFFFLLRAPHFDFCFRFMLVGAAGFSVPITESCDEDDDEIGAGVVEELVDKPGTMKSTSLDILESILLFSEM